MNYNALYVTTDDKIEEIYITKNNINSIQKCVGGNFECLTVDGLTLYINEEGLLLELPINKTITNIVFKQTEFPVVGNVVITGKYEKLKKFREKYKF